MSSGQLKEIIIEQSGLQQAIQPGVTREVLPQIEKYISLPHVIVISGIRRAGKSTLLAEIAKKHFPHEAYYLSFEDERLLDFTVQDFNKLYETFIECYGERKVFFFDEIQNIEKWEIFVRRMQDRGYKFFITGSNASLLSKELGTKLTGRSAVIELYPFSFREFLSFHHFSVTRDSLFDTQQRGLIKKRFHQYLEYGGMPEYLKYQDATLLKRTYDDILYRDIIARHEIKEIKALREMGLYLLSNVSHLISYNKLKKILELGSVNTVKNYAQYLEDSYLTFTTNRFSYSLKEQTVANKKIYTIDNGIVEAIAFQFSKNSGNYLENLVFQELKRSHQEIYYYKTKNNLEVDFLIREGQKIKLLIQVTEHMDHDKTKNRELNALIEAMDELKHKKAWILTLDHHEDISVDDRIIYVRPVYQWLLALEG